MLLSNLNKKILALVVVFASMGSTINAQGQQAPSLEDATERSFADFLTAVSLDEGSAAKAMPDETEPAPGQAGGGTEDGSLDDFDTDGLGADDAKAVQERAEAAETQEVNESLLTLADVVASVYQSYPKILETRQETVRASGEVTSAYGSFDTKLNLHSINEPTGFYENYRHGIGVARQTWWGGYVSAGYRMGRDDFQPWYQERSTHEAGEFKVGLGQAMLQGRGIDPARVAVFHANLDQRAVEPRIQRVILETSAEASSLYWQWVAMGRILDVQRELFELAEERGEQFAVGVEAGKFAEVDLILNRQLIAERKTKVLETQQKYQASTFKLSVFLRDADGRPMVPREDWLPTQFPTIDSSVEMDFNQDLAAAIARRPEPKLLQIERQKLQWDRQLACNQTLPRLDLIAEASQDVGAPATKSDDKGEFELVIGFRSEVPIQRRKARGKIQSTSAKIAQLDQKIRLQTDKIGAELQLAINRLQMSTSIVEQSALSLEAALETLDRYQFAFSKGKIDLIYLNFLETKAFETKIKLVEAQRDWFVSLAKLQAILGLDPLEQAFVVSSLP